MNFEYTRLFPSMQETKSSPETPDRFGKQSWLDTKDAVP